MYNEEGETTWQRSLGSNGAVKTGDNSTCPFLYQGQYYDKETELAYNRFRYYSPEDGRYINQDPIGLASGEFNFYAYVDDPSILLDVAGLASSTYVKFKRWKRGDAIDQPLPDGSNPSWGTVRGRYWKNRYEASKNSGQFTKKRDRQKSSRAHSPILLLIKQKTVF